MLPTNGLYRRRKKWTVHFHKWYHIPRGFSPRLVPFTFLCLLFVMFCYRTNSPNSPLHLRLKNIPEPNSVKCLKSRPLYIFLHLHKTGGNSLKEALYAFAKKNKLNLFHTCHRSHIDSRFESLYFHRNKDNRGTDCNLEELANLTSAQLDVIDLIMGHQFFGVHELFPNRDPYYFTFVRHPLQRKLSHYHHFESNNATVREDDLYEYLLHKNRNYMVKRLSTDGVVSEVWTDIRSQVMDRDSHSRHAALVEAKRHLMDYFFFVGLYEQFAQSACMLSTLLNSACGRRGMLGKRVKTGERNITRIRRNVRGHQMRNRLPDNIRNNTLHIEDVDLKLYDFAKMLYFQSSHEVPECGQ